MINLKKTEGINHFRDLPFISFSKTSAPSISYYANMICANAGFSPRVVSTSGQLDSVLRLVSAGLGWSIVPTQSLTNFTMKINARELKDLPERIIVGIAIQEGHNDLLVSSILDIAVNYFSATEAMRHHK
jgi:DNA-binding transcriptional LysR family regulator